MQHKKSAPLQALAGQDPSSKGQKMGMGAPQRPEVSSFDATVQSEQLSDSKLSRTDQEEEASFKDIDGLSQRLCQRRNNPSKHERRPPEEEEEKKGVMPGKRDLPSPR